MGRPPKAQTPVRTLATSEWLRTAFTLFTGFMVLVAVGAVALSFYGPALKDTAIYRNLSEVVPPVFNVEIIAYLGVFAMMFLAQAFTVGLKANTFEFLGQSAKRRRIATAVAATILSISILLILVGHFAASYGYKELGEFASRGIGFSVSVTLSALAIGLMYFVILPRAWHAAIPVNPLTRLAAFAGSVVLFLLFLASFELGSGPTLEVTPSQQSQTVQSTHSISAILDGLPNRMESLSNTAVTLKFRLTPFNPRETGPRYPVSLDSEKTYSVSAVIEGTGFDISAPPEALTRPRPVALNQLMTWTWLIAPKPERAGSRQMLLVRLFLHDRVSGELVYTAPIVTHVVEVRTPLGLPAWALSPSVTVGAVLIAALSIVGNFLLQRIWPKQEGD